MKFVSQSDPAECGLACVTMLALHYHVNVNIAAIRRWFPVSTRGMTLLDIRSCAEKIGLEAKFFKAQARGLRSVPMPFIAHWRGNHFIVVLKLTNKKVYVLDPAYGKITYPWPVFADGYSGYIATLHPKPGVIAEHLERNTLNFIRFTFLWIGSHVKGITAFALLSIVLEVIALAFPYQFQRMMSGNQTGTADVQSVFLVAGGFMVLALTHLALWTLRSRTSSSLSASLSKNLADIAFTNAMRLPMNYYKVRHTASVLTKFTSLEVLGESLTGSAVGLMLSGFTSIGYLIFCFLYSPLVGVTSLVCIIAYMILLAKIFEKKEVLIHAKINAHTKQQQTLIESIRCVQAVKLYQKQETSTSRFEQSTYKTADADRRFDFLTGFQHGAHTFINTATGIIVLALAGRTLITGKMSVGMVFAMVAYSSQFVMRSTSFLDLIFEMKNLTPYMHWVDDILDQQVYTNKRENNQPYSATPVIVLEHVSFRYEATDDWILRDVTLRLIPRRLTK